MPTPIEERIIEEFDEKYVDISEDRSLWNLKKDVSVGQIRYFILSSLSHALTEKEKEILAALEEKVGEPNPDSEYDDALNVIIKNCQKVVTEVMGKK